MCSLTARATSSLSAKQFSNSVHVRKTEYLISHTCSNPSDNKLHPTLETELLDWLPGVLPIQFIPVRAISFQATQQFWLSLLWQAFWFSNSLVSDPDFWIFFRLCLWISPTDLCSGSGPLACSVFGLLPVGSPLDLVAQPLTSTCVIDAAPVSPSKSGS